MWSLKVQHLTPNVAVSTRMIGGSLGHYYKQMRQDKCKRCMNAPVNQFWIVQSRRHNYCRSLCSSVLILEMELQRIPREEFHLGQDHVVLFSQI